MRVILQRVSQASVTIDNKLHALINKGILILVGIEEMDNTDDVNWLVTKLLNLRIFNDEHGKMNVNVMDSNGELLVVSQFTLHASTKKGNRPSYIKAAKPEIAVPIYEAFIAELKKRDISVKQGVFGADMKVSLINDGPVTLFIDTKNKE